MLPYVKKESYLMMETFYVYCQKPLVPTRPDQIIIDCHSGKNRKLDIHTKNKPLRVTVARDCNGMLLHWMYVPRA